MFKSALRSARRAARALCAAATVFVAHVRDAEKPRALGMLALAQRALATGAPPHVVQAYLRPVEAYLQTGFVSCPHLVARFRKCVACGETVMEPARDGRTSGLRLVSSRDDARIVTADGVRIRGELRLVPVTMSDRRVTSSQPK